MITLLLVAGCTSVSLDCGTDEIELNGECRRRPPRDDTDQNDTDIDDTDVGPKPDCSQLVPYEDDLLFSGFGSEDDMVEFCDLGYNAVNGTLRVEGATNLDGLWCVCAAELLDLWEYQGSYEGLKNLESAGLLSLGDLDDQREIDGFESLTRIESIYVDNFIGISGLTGLQSLEVIEDNPQPLSEMNMKFVQHIDFFPSLTAWNGTLEINNNNNILTVSGFGSLTEIEGDLVFNRVRHLQSITGFGPVVARDNVEITYNNVLTDISGLASFDRIEGVLIIRNNENLDEDHIWDVIDQIGQQNISSITVESNKP